MSSTKIKRSILLIVMIISYCLAMFFFVISLSKEAMHLAIFLQYFSLPKGFIKFLYGLPISKIATLRLLNFMCSLFVTSHFLYSLSYQLNLKKRVKKKLIMVMIIYQILILLIYDPNIYICIYKTVYPNVLSQLELMNIYSNIKIFTRISLIIILILDLFFISKALLKQSFNKIQKFYSSLAIISLTLFTFSYIIIFDRFQVYL